MMKIRSMNFDQYKISIEAHSLQTLYTKYNATETTQSQSVRPLGKIRCEFRPSSEIPAQSNIVNSNGEKGINVKKDMDFSSRVQSGRPRLKCDQNISSMDIRDKENNNFPPLTRSKTQAFENRFKIASSRTLQESPSPTLRPARHFEKKVVHLPLFKINLRSSCGDEDVSRTVAKTRESLRKLMELNKVKMKNANVITANIKNYEFNAPTYDTGVLRDGSIDSPRTMASQPFHAKPALRSSRSRELRTKQNTFTMTKVPGKISAPEKNKTVENTTDESQEATKMQVQQVPQLADTEDEPDCSMLSLAIRPDTSLTLGTTMHQIDRVIKSPTSEELKELSEAFKNTDTTPAWPSVDDIQTMLARSQSRTTRSKSRTPFSRPATVLNNIQPLPEEEFSQTRMGKHSILHPTPYGHGQKPVLRYTSKQSTYKLDPIIVPSHTCTECPMCNIYQRDVETPCPPNTPNTSQFMYEQETRPVYMRGTRANNVHSNHEVLRISRINMTGYTSPQDDPGGVLAYLRTVPHQ